MHAPALAATLAALALALTAPAARSAEPVKFVVLLEGGLGGGAQAQAYVDQFVGGFARRCAWPSAASLYTNARERALAYVASDKPQFGLFSLGAYLALAGRQGLVVVGQADAKAAGGRRYHVVAKQGAGLAACKGQPLASNHAADPRFVDRVVFAGAARLSDFTLVETARPVLTLKKVIRDEARCALIDDAQAATLATVEGGASLKILWSSAELPPIPVVAFPGAAPGVVRAFQAALPEVCAGADRVTCTNIGLERLAVASDAHYAALREAYDGPERVRQ